MHKQRQSVLPLMSLMFFSCFLFTIGPTYASTTVTVDRAVHVTTAEGSDLVLGVGDYVVEPAQDWIRVTPSSGLAIDAHLLEAQAGKHEEKLTDPLALSVPGVQPDSHHLVLLLPSGQSFAAHGSYSGIRSRGRSSIDMKRILALAAKRKRAQRTEFVTPSFGGSGGNRSYNLDCGNQAVLVGSIYKSGLWMDAIGIICQRVNTSNGSLGDEFTRGPVGGTGGRPKQTRCPSGQVVQGFTARSGSYIDGGTFFCRDWFASEKKPRFSTKAHCQEGTCRSFGSKSYSGYNDAFFCPNGKVGKALRGKYGSYIDSTRFVCDFWNK